MRYLGGKALLGRMLTEVMAPVLRGAYVWEPFCGGLNMTPHLARASLGVFASDANPALIATVNAVRAGWDPPSTLTREEWQAAKALPDSDPLKAFAGFGVSFGGMWFGSFAGEGRNGDSPLTYCQLARRNILREAPTPLRADCVSFLEVEPHAPAYPLVLYCDPPYAGTAGYAAVGKFDHAEFWARAARWSRFCPVFVSEFVAPEGWDCLWSRTAKCRFGAGTSGKGKQKTERLFYRGPECAP